MNILLRVNMPKEQRSREMKLAPSGYSWELKREASQYLMFFQFFIVLGLHLIYYWKYIANFSIGSHYIQIISLYKSVSYLFMELKDQITHVVPPAPRAVRGEPSFLEAGPDYLLYFNGCTVVLRPYDNSSSLFVSHSCAVTAVKYAFGYKQIASIDQKGNLLIHVISSEGSERSLRLLYSYEGLYAGARAIDWTSDNKRICIVGSGKNKFGRIISVEMGTDIGQITGVSANLSTVSFRSERPYKLIAGGQQFTIKFYQGPPYKFISSKVSHKNYINQVKYSPDGKRIVSVGSDRKIVVYDGTTCQMLKQLESAHAGGIMGVAWLDNETFVTGGSDKKLKRWNANLEQEAELDSNENKQQLALIDSFVVAVTYNTSNQLIYYLLLSGQIKEADHKLHKITNSYEGYRNKIIKILPIPSEGDAVILVDEGGKLLKLSLQKQNYTLERYLRGVLCYNKAFYDACVADGGLVHLLGGESQVYNLSPKDILSSHTQPNKLEGVKFLTALSCGAMDAFVGYTDTALRIYQVTNGKYQKVGEHKLTHQPKCVYASTLNNPQSNIVFVGSQKGFLELFSIESDGEKSIKVTRVLECQTNQNKITFIKKFNNVVFTGDSAGNIRVHQLILANEGCQFKKITDSMGGSHTTVVNSIIIHGSRIYTFSLDNKLSFWNLSDYSRVKTLLDVHRHGVLCGELIGDRICSSGGDLLIKVREL